MSIIAIKSCIIIFSRHLIGTVLLDMNVVSLMILAPPPAVTHFLHLSSRSRITFLNTWGSTSLKICLVRACTVGTFLWLVPLRCCLRGRENSKITPSQIQTVGGGGQSSAGGNHLGAIICGGQSSGGQSSGTGNHLGANHLVGNHLGGGAIILWAIIWGGQSSGASHLGGGQSSGGQSSGKGQSSGSQTANLSNRDVGSEAWGVVKVQ